MSRILTGYLPAENTETDPLKRKLAATVKRLKEKKAEETYANRMRHQYKLDQRSKALSRKKDILDRPMNHSADLKYHDQEDKDEDEE